ncbi:hypothetical protein HPP92_017972 [Vanilla planifolia]|uniref:S-adenosylmethionine decarboxylase proenzyme n=1 Tax=Vanilla planifolia TaxID=51239 RepID=A0A835QFG6_VANPL|nr:hypothetical protein HPP92_017972 [Vanilla planifolia]
MRGHQSSSRIPQWACFSAKEMTWSSGISEIIPEMEICDFEFDPCGYSMNGICNQALSTIHVTPEEGFSYASYEAMGFEPNAISYGCLIERVLRCFEPADFSVAVTIFGGHSFACSYGKKVDVDGYNCKDLVQQHLPGGGLLLYQSFSRSVIDSACSPRSTLYCCDEEEFMEQNIVENKKMVF